MIEKSFNLNGKKRKDNLLESACMMRHGKRPSKISDLCNHPTTSMAPQRYRFYLGSSQVDGCMCVNSFDTHI
jgi:hypothetical protein